MSSPWLWWPKGEVRGNSLHWIMSIPKMHSILEMMQGRTRFFLKIFCAILSPVSSVLCLGLNSQLLFKFIFALLCLFLPHMGIISQLESKSCSKTSQTLDWLLSSKGYCWYCWMQSGLFNLNKKSQEKNRKSESSSHIRANSSRNCGFLCLLKFVISSEHVFGAFSHDWGYFK